MKSISIVSLASLAVFATVVAPQAQAPSASAKFTDVYHVNFTKAALGRARQLGDSVKVQDPAAPQKGHYLVLRHQDGDAWDYATIEHLGTRATVEVGGAQAAPAERDLRAWHEDTFVSGPSWAEFAKAMGLVAPASTAASVYRIATYRAATGHRDQLQAILLQPPAKGDTSSGGVTMQHLEGGTWQYIVIDRYNSWQDFATNESNGKADIQAGKGGWYDVRDHADVHHDTLTDRVAP